MGRNPSFFKIMHTDFTDQIRIPPAFVTHFRHRLLRKKLHLNISGGVHGVVHLNKVGNDLYFKQGWKEFVKDNSIQVGDLLVFKLLAESMFFVKLYGKTCCQKDINKTKIDFHGTSSSKQKQPREEANKSVKESVPLGGYVDDENRRVKEGRTREQHDKGRLTRRRICKPVTCKEKSSLAEYEFTSIYPFFKMRLLPRYVHRAMLGVPNFFVRAYLPKEPTNISILDSRGRTWPTLYKWYGEGRGFILKGWSAFVSANNLKEGYVCAFELIDREDIKIKLSILRKINVHTSKLSEPVSV